MNKKEKIFIVIFLMGLILLYEILSYCFKDKVYARETYSKIIIPNDNKYSVKVTNKNWTWDNIEWYEEWFRISQKPLHKGYYSNKIRNDGLKSSNALYLNDKLIGVLFNVSFENEEPKLNFIVRDDIKIKSNSHLKQVGRDFIIIENPNGVYDDKKEFKYIDNNNTLPYENNEEIEEKSVVVRGLQIANLSPAIANKYKIYGKKGVVVTRPYNQTFGGYLIKDGDLIVSLAGEPVKNVKDFCNIIVNIANLSYPRVDLLRQSFFKQEYIAGKTNNDECLAYIKKGKK